MTENQSPENLSPEQHHASQAENDLLALKKGINDLGKVDTLLPNNANFNRVMTEAFKK